ncbi:MAG: formylglycine-generating enzyme family protein [Bacteroidales bacterium]|nr:formylglycine-generating enzyme family protein [Bacteroidales bacterium]
MGNYINEYYPVYLLHINDENQISSNAFEIVCNIMKDNNILYFSDKQKYDDYLESKHIPNFPNNYNFVSVVLLNQKLFDGIENMQKLHFFISKYGYDKIILPIVLNDFPDFQKNSVFSKIVSTFYQRFVEISNKKFPTFVERYCFNCCGYIDDLNRLRLLLKKGFILYCDTNFKYDFLSKLINFIPKFIPAKSDVEKLNKIIDDNEKSKSEDIDVKIIDDIEKSKSEEIHVEKNDDNETSKLENIDVNQIINNISSLEVSQREILYKNIFNDNTINQELLKTLENSFSQNNTTNNLISKLKTSPNITKKVRKTRRHHKLKNLDNTKSCYYITPTVVVKKPEVPVIKDITVKLSPKLSIDMIYVEGGTFNMGTKDGAFNESPVHPVTLKDFYISKFLVYQDVWSLFMNNKSDFKGFERPVDSVTWDECQQFLTKINISTNKSFRLPTEAEWEYAARGGKLSQNFKFSGSNNIDEVAWYGFNKANSSTHNVGNLAPNELGIFDMSGNVCEWCSDWYRDKYSFIPNINPIGPETGEYKVLRGGSWRSYQENCTVFARDKASPNSTSKNIGFRLVLPF